VLIDSGDPLVQGNAGGCRQSRGLVKSTVPSENLASAKSPMKSTLLPENAALSKRTVLPMNVV
jgi:hypothetical protein